MSKTYESNLQGKGTAKLCESLVTRLEDMNYSIAALAKEATPETLQLLSQVKGIIYPSLIEAREIKRRQAKSQGK